MNVNIEKLKREESKINLRKALEVEFHKTYENLNCENRKELNEKFEISTESEFIDFCLIMFELD